jgi:Flp pilus assembly protein CpaB
MKSSRGGLKTIFAFVLAAVAALMAYGFAIGDNNEAEPPVVAVAAATEVPMAPVVVLTKDLAAATVLTEDMVEVRKVPLDAVSSRALSKLDQAVGKTTTVPLARGEQLLETRLTGDDADPSTFAYEVPAGYRAISVVFDEVQGVGGLVQPGDHVDVIAYWQFKLTVNGDAAVDSSADDATEGDEDAASDDENETDDSQDNQNVQINVNVEKDYRAEYDQSISAYIVQNVEVLAVAQALTPDQARLDVNLNLPSQETPEATNEGEDPNSPVARPGAKSVTLAVTPEQAQRLLMAAQSVTDKQEERDAALRLVVRAPGDNVVADLSPIQLGTLPEEYRQPFEDLAVGEVYRSSVANDLVITDAQFEKRVLNQGETLYFTATVKNISDETIESGDNAPPEYTYTQGIAYDTLGFFPDENTYRIGLNVSGAFPTNFPYRWSLGRDLEPGETARISGSVQLTEPIPDATYWLGIIQEPNVVTQDGVSVTHIMVNAAAEVSVEESSASVLAEPDPASEVVQVVERGAKLSVMEARGPWFHVRMGDEDGWIAAGAITVEPAPEVALDGEITVDDESLMERGRQLIPWTREERT